MDKTQIQLEAEAVQRYKNDNNMSFAAIADAMGFSESTAKRRYKFAQTGMTIETVVAEALEDFPDDNYNLDSIIAGEWLEQEKGPIERFDPLVRTGDAIVICDLHIPLHNPKMINEVIFQARECGITKLIIAGDYWNMDSFSSYLPHQPEADLPVEIYDGNLIMKTLLNTFEEVDFIWGNHDFRLSKKLGFKKSFKECITWMFQGLTEEEMAKIRISDLDYMWYYPDPLTLQKFYICHPRNFSSIPLTVGRKLATKFNCSVITGHSHHLAMGFALNGRDIVIEGGGLYDPSRTEYIQKSTAHHSWVPGFTVFTDGIPTLISPRLLNTEVI